MRAIQSQQLLVHTTLWLTAAMLAGCGGGHDGVPTAAAAQPATSAPESNSTDLLADQGRANASAGPRHVPARDIPIPSEDISATMRDTIAAPYPTPFNAAPGSAEEWKALVGQRAAATAAALPALQKKFGVSVERTVIANVPVFMVKPEQPNARNAGRLLMHLHGGSYINNPGSAAVGEAVLMASFGGFTVVSVDYRMPPDFPFPAAMDDATAVWKELVRRHDPAKMAVFGSSSGGAMTLALMLRAKSEQLPLPAAMAPGTPWADIQKVGDSYFTNEWLDNAIVSWDGLLGRAARLYANGHDLKDPQISPIYGDFTGLPPSILTSGTRDLFLSNTVRTHRKLRRAGVEAELNVYEGQSHAQYATTFNAPETKEAFTDITRFFDTHLAH